MKACWYHISVPGQYRYSLFTFNFIKGSKVSKEVISFLFTLSTRLGELRLKIATAIPTAPVIPAAMITLLNSNEYAIIDFVSK